MATLILDVAIWRSGGDGENKTGEGRVQLCNDKGYMCCVGQWCEQMGVPKMRLVGLGSPRFTSRRILGFTETVDFIDLPHYQNGYANTRFVNDAIFVNDDKNLDPNTRIESLQAVAWRHGHIILTKNRHLI